jgi:transcriptional regulator with XRE-family HTH domain
MHQAIEGIVANRIKSAREGKKLSLRRFSEACGISASHLSQIEKGKISPTVSTLRRIADGLGIPLTEFFKGAADEESIIVRRGRGELLTFPGSKITYELLVAQGNRSSLEPFYAELQVDAFSGLVPHSHRGEEFIYVISGKMGLMVDHEEYVLNEGDSACFRSDNPHQWRNLGKEACRVIWVTTPPLF